MRLGRIERLLHLLVAARPRCWDPPNAACVRASGVRSELKMLTIPLRVMIDEQLQPVCQSRAELVIFIGIVCFVP